MQKIIASRIAFEYDQYVQTKTKNTNTCTAEYLPSLYAYLAFPFLSNMMIPPCTIPSPFIFPLIFFCFNLLDNSRKDLNNLIGFHVFRAIFLEPNAV